VGKIDGSHLRQQHRRRLPESGRIPSPSADESEVLRAAIGCTPGVDIARPRIVRIRNTLDLGVIEVSEALLDDVRREPRLVIEG